MEKKEERLYPLFVCRRMTKESKSEQYRDREINEQAGNPQKRFSNPESDDEMEDQYPII